MIERMYFISTMVKGDLSTQYSSRVFSMTSFIANHKKALDFGEHTIAEKTGCNINDLIILSFNRV